VPKRPEPLHKPPTDLNDSSANNEKMPAKLKKPVKKPNQPADKISQQPQPVKPLLDHKDPVKKNHDQILDITMDINNID
jgi:hypothetical protein